MKPLNVHCGVNQSGFGIIQVLILVAILTIITLAAVSLNTQLIKQNVQIVQLNLLSHFVHTIPRFVGDNPSWTRTVNSNGNMACLRNGAGASCPTYRRQQFDLYDPNGTFVLNSTNASNGINTSAQLCGPIISAGNKPPNVVSASLNANFSATNASTLCPFRYQLEWVAMDPNPYPVVAIIVTLIIGLKNNKPVLDIVINPDNYSYPAPTDPPWNPSDPNWPQTLIYRSAI